MPKISGGRLCGAVRYQCSAEPLGTAICHCTHCQKVSGSALYEMVTQAPQINKAVIHFAIALISIL